MDARYVRRSVIGLIAGSLALPIMGGEARGGRCELPRRPQNPKPPCGHGLKLCGNLCIPNSAACCHGQGYTTDCPSGRHYVCKTAGQCCNGGESKCDPAAAAC